MHEQSETIQDKLGRWINVFGRGTPQAGTPLPKKYDWERPYYKTVEEAVEAAKKRSAAEQTDPTMLEPVRPPRLRRD
jgi:hypothetical protein